MTILSSIDPTLPTSEIVDGLKIARLLHPRLARVMVPLSAITRFTRSADVVIDNADIAIPWLTPIFLRKPRLCIIYQVAGEIFQHELPRPLSKVAIGLEPWIYRVYWNTKIVTCSDSTKMDLVQLGLSRNNITVVKPGLSQDFPGFEPNGEKSENPTIVCISRFMRYKGLHYAIQAMKYIRASVPTAQLIIVGNGDISMISRELSRSPHADSIKIVTRPPHSWDREKATLLASSHVLLIPSVREGYGIVAIEANACGTSAVGWNVPGLRDSIIDGETGVLVPFGDVERMASEVVRLLQDSDMRKNMASRAVDWARTHSWDKAAEEFDRVITSLW